MNHPKRIMLALAASAMATVPAFAAEPIRTTSSALNLQESKDLGSILRNRTDLSTFRMFTETVGVYEPLQTPGADNKGYTVFIPDDSAFAKLPPQVASELRENRVLMAKVLKYHMVAGNMSAASITGASAPATLLGEHLSISKSGKRITVGNAWVVESLSGSNGTIHVIDRVLLPPSIRDHFIRRAILPLNDEKAAVLGAKIDANRRNADRGSSYVMSGNATASGRPGRFTRGARGENLMAVATGTADLSTFQRLATEAGIANWLMEGTHTVFAPTNAAFDRLPKMAMDALTADKDLLKQVLMYHVLRGETTSDEFRRSTIQTAGGSTVRMKVGRKGAAKVNDAIVLDTDLLAKNGAIHTINKVLIPIPVASALRAKGIVVED